MRNHIGSIFSFMTGAVLYLVALAVPSAFADTTVTLEQPVHFTNAEGSDVVLPAGDYAVEPAEAWLRVTPSGRQTVDAALLEAQSATHEESLTTPMALSAEGEQPNTHHLALLLPDGKRLEAIGSYSGIRSRGTLSLLTIQRLRTLSSTSQSTTPTEFSTPLFGGSGGNRSYNLDCGNQSVLVGVTYKSGMWLDAIGIICQQVNPQTGALGNEFTRGPVGGSGGLARPTRCNQGDVVQGISVLSGQFIESGFLPCSPWLPAQKMPEFSTSTECRTGSGRCVAQFGTNYSSNSGRFHCPSGKVGKAIRGRHGIYIDSLRFVCDFWDK
ncbi:MAG: hypothetical protein OEZ57_01245 [Nitrospirota bacterium]|nr:hypothetical protein [Nitrospirota bacterium]MDH5585076.1 hypothetical protein [Nitrospirota bacterium]MDH5773525.1 hypothetical protein [Nitrospirota bacterium]